MGQVTVPGNFLIENLETETRTEKTFDSPAERSKKPQLVKAQDAPHKTNFETVSQI